MKITTVKDIPFGLASTSIDDADKWLKLIRDGKTHKVADVGKPEKMSDLIRSIRYIGNKYGYLVKTKAQYKNGIVYFKGYKRELEA